MERALAERTHHPRWEAARATVIFRDINDEVRSREQVSSRLSVLEDLADRDPLTGPLNRRGFAVARHHLTATADRQAKVCRFVFVDVDRLEAVNDAGGHAAGGAALVAVASAIQRAVRGADIAARFGGDEFVIVTIERPGLTGRDDHRSHPRRDEVRPHRAGGALAQRRRHRAQAPRPTPPERRGRRGRS